MKDRKENQGNRLHIHRTHPILFGGDPTDSKNITFVSRLQHAELATFWNRKIKELKNQPGKKNPFKSTNQADIIFPVTAVTIEIVEKIFDVKFPSDYIRFLEMETVLKQQTDEENLVLWTTEELVTLNRAYHVREFADNVIIIGSDGAEEAYAFYTTDMNIVRLPFIGMGHIANEKIADTFSQFVTLIKGEGHLQL